MPAEVENISRLTLVGRRENSAAGPPATCHRPRKSATRRLRLPFPQVPPSAATSTLCRHRRTRTRRHRGRDWKNLAGDGGHPTVVAPTRPICMPRVGKRRRRTKVGVGGRSYVTSKQYAGGSTFAVGSWLSHRQRRGRQTAGTQPQSVNQSATTTFWTGDNNSPRRPATNHGHTNSGRESARRFRLRINRRVGNRPHFACLPACRPFIARSREGARAHVVELCHRPSRRGSTVYGWTLT